MTDPAAEYSQSMDGNKKPFLSAKHLLPEDEGSVCGIHNLR